jgi:hypothetical protein
MWPLKSDSDTETNIINGCDPGIRNLVKLLRDVGFNTCDSGDGVTKFEGKSEAERLELIQEGYLDYPHVFIEVEWPESVMYAAHELQAYMKKLGVDVRQVGDGYHMPFIQATYDPVTKVGIVELAFVRDVDISKESNNVGGNQSG